MADRKLLAWGMRKASRLPRLWLFTDPRRMRDPLAAARGLPPGRAGIVFRHDTVTGRDALGRRLARLCRARRIVLVVAGDPRLAAALGAGLHLRSGRRPASCRPPRLATASAHSVPEAVRARRSGANLVFLSPVFPTASHPGAPVLGPLRWNRMVRAARLGPRAAALGGVDGAVIRRLDPACQAAGAIGALAE